MPRAATPRRTRAPGGVPAPAGRPARLAITASTARGTRAPRAPTVHRRRRRHQRARLHVRRAPTAPPAPRLRRRARPGRTARAAPRRPHPSNRASTPMIKGQRSTAARAGVIVSREYARSVNRARTGPRRASPRRRAPVTVRRATTAQLVVPQPMKKRAAAPHTSVRKGPSRRLLSEAATSPSIEERARARASRKKF